MAEHRTSLAAQNLRKLENLIRASDEIINEEDDQEELLADPMNYNYEILGHTEADWDPLELQMSPDKQSSVSTIEQLSRLAREVDQEDLAGSEDMLDWPFGCKVSLLLSLMCVLAAKLYRLSSFEVNDYT